MESLIRLKAVTDSFSSEMRNWHMKVGLVAKLDNDEEGVEISIVRPSLIGRMEKLTVGAKVWELPEWETRGWHFAKCHI